MNEVDFREKAISAIVNFFNNNRGVSDSTPLEASMVYVVWQCKVLQNNKALLSTTVSDGMYYEFTWNGDKEEGYLDCYKKWSNSLVK